MAHKHMLNASATRKYSDCNSQSPSNSRSSKCECSPKTKIQFITSWKARKTRNLPLNVLMLIFALKNQQFSDYESSILELKALESKTKTELLIKRKATEMLRVQIKQWSCLNISISFEPFSVLLTREAQEDKNNVSLAVSQWSSQPLADNLFP